MFCCGLQLLTKCLKSGAEESMLIIRCGKPIFLVQYRTIKFITTVTVLAILITMLYCIGIFITSVKIKLRIGVLINMVSPKDGDVLPTLFAMPALMCLLLNGLALWLLHGLFKRETRKWFNTIVYGFVLVCLASIGVVLVVCITILTHVYGKHERLHDGIVDAMNNYSTDSKIKKEVDLMQIEFQCCGSKKYDEWYDIKWLDTSLVKAG